MPAVVAGDTLGPSILAIPRMVVLCDVTVMLTTAHCRLSIIKLGQEFFLPNFPSGSSCFFQR